VIPETGKLRIGERGPRCLPERSPAVAGLWPADCAAGYHAPYMAIGPRSNGRGHVL
jgi:hypothetical protein